MILWKYGIENYKAVYNGWANNNNGLNAIDTSSEEVVKVYKIKQVEE